MGEEGHFLLHGWQAFSDEGYKSIPSTCSCMVICFAVAQSLSCVRLLATPWTAACQASLSFINSWSLLKFMSNELVMLCYLTISSSAAPISFSLQSFSASGSFPMSQFFASDGQSTGASASVLPMKYSRLISFRIDWFDLHAVPGTLKSLLQHNLKASILLSLLHGPMLTFIHDYWKSHSFD